MPAVEAFDRWYDAAKGSPGRGGWVLGTPGGLWAFNAATAVLLVASPVPALAWG